MSSLVFAVALTSKFQKAYSFEKVKLYPLLGFQISRGHLPCEIKQYTTTTVTVIK